MKNQLKIGIKIESEHASTVKYIKDYLKRYGKLPANKDIYKHIAQNHLEEDPRYYKKLLKCRL